MDRDTFEAVARASGALEHAVIDIVNRLTTAFGDREVTPAQLSKELERIKTTTGQHCYPAPAGGQRATVPEPPAWMNPTERLTWARTHGQDLPKRQRPARYDPTPEQLKSIEGQPPHVRLARYREWQAEAQKS